MWELQATMQKLPVGRSGALLQSKGEGGYRAIYTGCIGQSLWGSRGIISGAGELVSN